MEHKTQRKRGLAFRISLLTGVVFAVMAVIIVGVGSKLMTDSLSNVQARKMRELVCMEAEMMDGDGLRRYVETGETDEEYERLKRNLNSVKNNMAQIAYIYVFVPYEDHFVYVYDAVREGESLDMVSALGDVYEYGETEYTYLIPDIRNKRPSQGIVYGQDVGYGASVSAWAPIFDSQGEVAAMVEVDYHLEIMNQALMANVIPVALMLSAGLAVLLGVMLYLMRRNITAPLAKLTRYVGSYEEGRFSEESFHYDKDDEISWLNSTFNELLKKIDVYIEEIKTVTAEKERIGAELNVATQIQADMLPRIFPPFPERNEIDLYATMNPAKEVGGDFYDFFLLDEDHLALVIADVSGKGVPAALFMVIAKTLIKNRAQMGGTPAEILTDVNEQLCEGNEAELFVTVWLCIMEISTGKAAACNAGHEYPAIMRANGCYELLKDRHSPAVATMEGLRFRPYEFELNPGDRLFVYTDGVAEATDADYKLFGTERMLKALNADMNRTPEELLHGVKSALDSFVGSAPQFDDITMLSLYYYGKEAEEENSQMKELEIEASAENLEAVIGFVEGALEELNCPMKAQMQIDIAVEEIFVNIAHYAYGENTGKAIVRVQPAEDPMGVIVTLLDEGTPFDPLAKEDPDVSLSADERQVGGLGIFMVKKSMDEVCYEYADGMNILHLRKNF